MEIPRESYAITWKSDGNPMEKPSKILWKSNGNHMESLVNPVESYGNMRSYGNTMERLWNRMEIQSKSRGNRGEVLRKSCGIITKSDGILYESIRIIRKYWILSKSDGIAMGPYGNLCRSCRSLMEILRILWRSYGINWKS